MLGSQVEDEKWSFLGREKRFWSVDQWNPGKSTIPERSRWVPEAKTSIFDQKRTKIRSNKNLIFFDFFSYFFPYFGPLKIDQIICCLA